MKKVLIVLIALILAVPAVSFAGSATSRWDLTIGGFVKFDAGWADQGVSADMTYAQRKSYTKQNANDEYGNSYMVAGESRLNFLVKGPDTWGAKTSAFIEGDFRGSAVSSQYGVFYMRHAMMKFDWANTSLLIGQWWQSWGAIPCFCLLGVNDILPTMKANRNPQITVTQTFTKEWSLNFGVEANYDTLRSSGGASWDTSYSRNPYPDMFAELNFKTDKCGAIGPWMLQFGLGGMFGNEKVVYDKATGTRLADQSGMSATGAPGTDFTDKNVNTWAMSFKGYIPIIPQKSPGNMAGSLGLAGLVWTGQNLKTYLLGGNGGTGTPWSYNQNNALPNTSVTYVVPNVTGGWAQLFFYLTNTVSANFMYAEVINNFSNAYKARAFAAGTAGANTSAGGFTAINANNPEKDIFYTFNLIYDPNPAVRMGIELQRIHTKYAAPAGGLQDYGDVNTVRFAAIYFF